MSSRTGLFAARCGHDERHPRLHQQEHAIDIYFDFTCPYSRRAGRWWRELGEPASWRPFLLRENNRDDDGPAEWDREDALSHVSVLALALHEAVHTAGGDVSAYRWAVVDLFENGPVDVQALHQHAAAAVGSELDDEQVRGGLAEVARSHRDALALAVFGTPTLVDGDAAAYLKLAAQPSPERVRAVFSAVDAVLHGTPEVAEIKRPS